MQASIQPFAIGDVSIRQLDGLFSLNDLHRASGGIESQRPNQFLRIDQTQALIQELETAQICAVKTKEGRNGGTYVCRELVIAYAAWISAAFHLKVIRVFLDATAPQSAKLTPAEKQSIREAVARKARKDDETYRNIYIAIHAHFGVNSYHDIPAGSLPEVLEIIEGFKASPAPVGNLDAQSAYRIWLICRHFRRLFDIYKSSNLYDHLAGLGSHIGYQMHDHFLDGILSMDLLQHDIGGILIDGRKTMEEKYMLN